MILSPLPLSVCVSVLFLHIVLFLLDDCLLDAIVSLEAEVQAL